MTNFTFRVVVGRIVFGLGLAGVCFFPLMAASFPTFWFGLHSGRLQTHTVDPEVDLDREGSTFGFRTGLELVNPNSVFELAAGWSNTRIYADTNQVYVLQPGENAEDVPLGLQTTEVATRLGYGMLSIRFPLVAGLQVGPVATIFSGVDTTFGPEPHLGKNPNVLFGLNLTWVVKQPSEKSPLAIRLYGEALQDLTIDTRDVRTATLGLDFGFGYYPQAKVITKKKTVIKYKPKLIVKYKQKVKLKEEFFIDAGIVNFETGKAHILPKARQYLAELALYLQRHLTAWNTLHIESHTDYRGSDDMNRKLSRDRAFSVARFLRSQGISGKRIFMKSNHNTAPVENKTHKIALAKNRRVEIFIRGPKATHRLRKEISRLQQKYQLPGTCRGGSCR
ncbi:MAG: OmpA family protein [Zetaproteobacteria bacterium]|nr:OmpA family protein [Zetaproteobacteria bacterium]